MCVCVDGESVLCVRFRQCDVQFVASNLFASLRASFASLGRMDFPKGDYIFMYKWVGGLGNHLFIDHLMTAFVSMSRASLLHVLCAVLCMSYVRGPLCSLCMCVCVCAGI